MAYQPTGLICLVQGTKQSVWMLRTSDAVGTSAAAGYITDAGTAGSGKGAAGRGMKIGDVVLIHVYSAGTVDAPTAYSDFGLYGVSVINATTGAATLVAYGAT